MKDTQHREYRTTVQEINQSCRTVPDDEYSQLAARDEVDRLLDEAGFMPPQGGFFNAKEMSL